eukprot:COSAG02_NODE_31055_length_540_cov_0.823129_1_plen_154_part_01
MGNYAWSLVLRTAAHLKNTGSSCAFACGEWCSLICTPPGLAQTSTSILNGIVCRSIDASQWSGAEKPSGSKSDQRCCSCANCQTHSADTKLKRCARCKAVFYCSVQCQQRSWATHRTCCSAASRNTAPSCWRKLYRYNHELLRNTFLDPGLDRT